MYLFYRWGNSVFERCSEPQPKNDGAASYFKVHTVPRWLPNCRWAGLKVKMGMEVECGDGCQPRSLCQLHRLGKDFMFQSLTSQFLALSSDILSCMDFGWTPFPLQTFKQGEGCPTHSVVLCIKCDNIYKNIQQNACTEQGPSYWMRAFFVLSSDWILFSTLPKVWMACELGLIFEMMLPSSEN